MDTEAPGDFCCTCPPMETMPVAKSLPGYSRHLAVAAEAGDLILRSTRPIVGRWVWARDRNDWVAANPEVEPRLGAVPERSGKR